MVDEIRIVALVGVLGTYLKKSLVVFAGPTSGMAVITSTKSMEIRYFLYKTRNVLSLKYIFFFSRQHLT